MDEARKDLIKLLQIFIVDENWAEVVDTAIALRELELSAKLGDLS